MLARLILSRVLLVFTFTLLLPILAVFIVEPAGEMLEIATPFILVLGASLVLVVILRPLRMAERPRRLETFETVRVVIAAWFLIAALSAIPFYLAGDVPSYTHAFFESMSGLTTTGATVIADVESMHHANLLWRSFIQWLGGMGIILLFIAVLPAFGGTFSLFRAEIPGGDLFHKFVPRFKILARKLWLTYMIVTSAEFLLLVLAGMTPFDAVCHAFTTMATGGFSTRNAGIAAFDSLAIELVIIAFMVLAGMSFGLHSAFLTGNRKAYRGNPELKTYLWILGVSTAVFTVLLAAGKGYNLPAALRHAAFQAASIMTTTGYATDDFALWPFAGQAMLLLLMAIGGCTGSTGGSVKVIRYRLLVSFMRHEFRRLIDPFRVKPMLYDGSVVSDRSLRQLFLMMVLFFLTFISTSLALTFMGVEGREAFSGALTCIANTGPGLGSVGPLANYTGIPGPGLWLLAVNMLIGRLEVVGVFLLITRYIYRLRHKRP